MSLLFKTRNGKKTAEMKSIGLIKIIILMALVEESVFLIRITVVICSLNIQRDVGKKIENFNDFFIN